VIFELLLTEEFLFLNIPMKFKKHGKAHEGRESKSTEKREDSNAEYRNAEKKMKMIETAMHGNKSGIRQSKNFRGK